MTALAAARNTLRETEGSLVRQYGVAASTLVFAGSLVLLNASGYATKGQAGLSMFGIGRAARTIDNSAGAAGDEALDVMEGAYRWDNSASADQLTIADVGGIAWCVDDHTVAKTSGSGTRSPAGIIVDVDAQGVWIKMGADVLTAWRKNRRRSVPLVLTTVAAAGSPVYRAISPFSGLVVELDAIIEGALTTGDATAQGKIAGANITGGLLTMTQSGSAAGNKFTAAPTAANYVNAGDELSFTIGGSEAAAIRANATFRIDVD